MYAFCCLLATAVAFRGPASPVAPARAAPLLRGAVEDHVTQRAEDLLMAIVKDKTALGNDIKRNNQRTGGSAVLEGVTLERCDADGLDMSCVVRRRVGGFGRKYETGDERANATWADLLPDDAAAAWAGGADAQRRLMQVACGLELPGAAARLLDAAFPGGLGDAGRLPDNLWLNNIPASKLARRHMSDACIAGVLDALGAPGAPSTLAVTIKPPELDVEMDTYRIGTLLELVRSLTFAIISERGERVRVAVQAPMGEGIFAGMPLSLNGVRKLLSLMDWGPDAAQLMDDGYVRFGAVSGRPEDVDDKDDVFVLVAPQSIVGSSIVGPLRDMVEAAGRRKVITINANLDDIQSSQGVMSYRGRGERLAFEDAWREIFHFSLVVPIGRTFFPILGAVVRPTLGSPYGLYQRMERASDPRATFRDSRDRARAAAAGELTEVYRPVGCYAAMPTPKEQKAAFAAALRDDFEREEARKKEA